MKERVENMIRNSTLEYILNNQNRNVRGTKPVLIERKQEVEKKHIKRDGKNERR